MNVTANLDIDGAIPAFLRLARSFVGKQQTYDRQRYSYGYPTEEPFFVSDDPVQDDDSISGV